MSQLEEEDTILSMDRPYEFLAPALGTFLQTWMTLAKIK